VIDPGQRGVEGLLRELAPQVLGVLVRRFGDFDACEDALQEALLAAALHWAKDGTPDNPRGWMLQTAGRRFIDLARSEADHHRLHAVRAHLLEMTGDRKAARAEYREAAALTTSLPERRYLLGRAAR